MTPRRLPYVIRRLGQICLATASIFVNCIFFGGSTHQTLSARLYVERRQRPRLYKAVDATFYFLLGEAGHCKNARDSEVEWAFKVLARNAEPDSD